MDGFDLIVAAQPRRPFYYYSEAQIPNYWQYARNFVLADHHFSTTLGPSSPGHEVFWFARSTSLDNAKCNTPDGGGCTGSGCTASSHVTITSYDPDTCTTKTVAPCFDLPVLPDHLPTGFTWSDYGGPMALQSKWVVSQPGYAQHFHKAADLVPDLTSGHLANLTIAHLSSGAASEHPTANPTATVPSSARKGRTERGEAKCIPFFSCARRSVAPLSAPSCREQWSRRALSVTRAGRF